MLLSRQLLCLGLASFVASAALDTTDGSYLNRLSRRNNHALLHEADEHFKNAAHSGTFELDYSVPGDPRLNSKKSVENHITRHTELHQAYDKLAKSGTLNYKTQKRIEGYRKHNEAMLEHWKKPEMHKPVPLKEGATQHEKDEHRQKLIAHHKAMDSYHEKMAEHHYDIYMHTKVGSKEAALQAHMYMGHHDRMNDHYAEWRHLERGGEPSGGFIPITGETRGYSTPTREMVTGRGRNKHERQKGFENFQEDMANGSWNGKHGNVDHKY